MSLNCMLDDELFSKITQQSLSCIRIRKQWILCRVGRYLRMRSLHQFQLFFPLRLSLSCADSECFVAARTLRRRRWATGQIRGFVATKGSDSQWPPRMRQITEVPSVVASLEAAAGGHSSVIPFLTPQTWDIPRIFHECSLLCRQHIPLLLPMGSSLRVPPQIGTCCQVHPLLLQPLS